MLAEVEGRTCTDARGFWSLSAQLARRWSRAAAPQPASGGRPPGPPGSDSFPRIFLRPQSGGRCGPDNFLSTFPLAPPAVPAPEAQRGGVRETYVAAASLFRPVPFFSIPDDARGVSASRSRRRLLPRTSVLKSLQTRVFCLQNYGSEMTESEGHWKSV